MKQGLFAILLTAFLAVGLATPATADLEEIEIIFVQADRNGDLVLNKSEVLLITISRFDDADSDRDNLLEKHEVGDLAKEAEFADNDTNKDGSLSLEEVIAEKLADFKEADTDNDGSLTLDEVREFYKNKDK